MSSSRSLLPLVAVVAAATAMTVGCSSDRDAQIDDETASGQPSVTTEETDDGLVAEQIDTNSDGEPDIIRYYEEYQDPRDEDRTRRRIRKMEIDVTNDGTINVRRDYDEFGNVTREENDQNLDGVIDTILEFTGEELSRKILKDDDGQTMIEQRIYYDGQLVRVEQDTSGDGTVDHWEYYEDEVLMRIGRDTNSDGSADTWQMR